MNQLALDRDTTAQALMIAASNLKRPPGDLPSGPIMQRPICSGGLLTPSPPAEKETDLHERSPSIIGGGEGALRLRTIHRAENIASALKRGVNVCQRQFVNEVLGPLVTEFIRNFGGEDATPIQHAFPTAAFSITGRLVKRIRHNALRHLMTN
jgi:hypothetical protein